METGSDVVRIPAGMEGALPLTLRVPDTVLPGLYVLLADVEWKGTALREWTEAVVEVVP